MYFNVGEKLSHLDDIELEKLIKEYMNLELSLSKIAERYGMRGDSHFYKQLPYVRDDDVICPHCGIAMYVKLPRRSDLRKERRKIARNHVCKMCDHTGNNGVSPYCHCSNCKAQRIMAAKEETQRCEEAVERYCQQLIGEKYNQNDLLVDFLVYLFSCENLIYFSDTGYAQIDDSELSYYFFPTRYDAQAFKHYLFSNYVITPINPHIYPPKDLSSGHLGKISDLFQYSKVDNILCINSLKENQNDTYMFYPSMSHTETHIKSYLFTKTEQFQRLIDNAELFSKYPSSFPYLILWSLLSECFAMLHFELHEVIFKMAYLYGGSHGYFGFPGQDIEVTFVKILFEFYYMMLKNGKTLGQIYAGTIESLRIFLMTLDDNMDLSRIIKPCFEQGFAKCQSASRSKESGKFSIFTKAIIEKLLRIEQKEYWDKNFSELFTNITFSDINNEQLYTRNYR